MTMERYVGAKKNIFYFQTEKGVFAIGADDPTEVAEAAWFREFLGLRKGQAIAQKEAPLSLDDLEELPDIPVPEPPKSMRAQPKLQPVFENPVFKEVPRQAVNIDVRPEQMTKEMWDSMKDDDRVAWRKKWLGV